MQRAHLPAATRCAALSMACEPVFEPALAGRLARPSGHGVMVPHRNGQLCRSSFTVCILLVRQSEGDRERRCDDPSSRAR